jgi:hypothetical protein
MGEPDRAVLSGVFGAITAVNPRRPGEGDVLEDAEVVVARGGEPGQAVPRANALQ